MHPASHDGGLEQVTPELREQDPARRLAYPVAGPANPLEPRGDARGRLDEHHEVDGAHVDAQLERRCRDDRRHAARLQVLFDLESLLPGDAAVMGPHELLAGQLVQALGEPLGEAPAVRENDRAVVGPDQLEELRVDRGPDARPEVTSPNRTSGGFVGRDDLAEPAHVLDRDDDPELERPLGRRQPDPLEARRAGRPKMFEALHRQREMRSAFRAGDRVDLVEDDGLDAAERLSGGARQQ